MTVLGIDMSDKEPVKGWESIPPHVHLENRLLALSVSAWKLASQMVDEGRSQDEIQRMQENAQAIEDLARSGADCKCVLPEQSCNVCRSLAHLIYNEEYTNER